MLDLAIVLAFVLYSVSAGLRARRQASRDLNEYFLAGRTLPGWKAGVSMAATQFAADTPLLVAGLVATGGVFLLWRLWIYGLAFLLMAFVFASLWRRANVLTDAAFTEIRYSGRGVLLLRGLKAVYYGTLFNCVVLAMVLVAAVRIAEVFLPWHQWLPSALHGAWASALASTGLVIAGGTPGLPPDIATANNLLSILLILGFTALYSTTGGLRGVVATDVAQFGLAMAGTAIYAGVLAQKAGGVGGLSDKVEALYGTATAASLLSFTPPSTEAMLPFAAVIGLQWLYQINADGTGYLAQRSMACRSDADARTAGIVFAWLQVVGRSLVWMVIAVALVVLYPIEGFPAEAGARERLFIVGLDEHLGPGLRGIMLTALLAALASTIDTHLNWGASYWSHDLYGRLWCRAWHGREPDPRTLVRVARGSTLLLVGLALVVMGHLGSIQEAWHTSLLFGAGLGAVLVLRWLWERINVAAELAAIAVSLVAAPLLLASPLEEWARLAVMAAAATTATIAAAVLLPPTTADTLDRFYRRVHPPGWWPATAARA
ncbi:MAG: sodium:solute symporter family protein, partial [Vicinamibacterales bacterium]|nr:sodium:solute symporter family protein [Vicinamibacterales bacterium]